MPIVLGAIANLPILSTFYWKFIPKNMSQELSWHSWKRIKRTLAKFADVSFISGTRRGKGTSAEYLYSEECEIVIVSFCISAMTQAKLGPNFREFWFMTSNQVDSQIFSFPWCCALVYKYKNLKRVWLPTGQRRRPTFHKLSASSNYGSLLQLWKHTTTIIWVAFLQKKY